MLRWAFFFVGNLAWGSASEVCSWLPVALLNPSFETPDAGPPQNLGSWSVCTAAGFSGWQCVSGIEGVFLDSRTIYAGPSDGEQALALDNRGELASFEQVVTLDESFAGLRLSFNARLGGVGGTERQADGGRFRVDLTVDGALAASYSDTMDSTRRIGDSTQLSTPMDSVTLTAASVSGAAGAELVVKFSYDTRGETSLFNSRVYLDNVRLERCAAPTAPTTFCIRGSRSQLIFGTNDECTLEHTLGANSLTSTCPINAPSGRRLQESSIDSDRLAQLEIKVAQIETDNAELKKQVPILTAKVKMLEEKSQPAPM